MKKFDDAERTYIQMDRKLVPKVQPTTIPNSAPIGLLPAGT